VTRSPPRLSFVDPINFLLRLQTSACIIYILTTLTSGIMNLKSIVASAAMAITLAFQPGAASAMGVGADGYIRGMWHGTDGRISVWKFDSNFNQVQSQAYGPYSGWSPVADVVLGNNTYVLWRNDDGSAEIWILDANLNFVTGQTFGPVTGWLPTGLGSFYGNQLRLFWSANGEWTTWELNGSLGYVAGSPIYGPYFGWMF